MLQTALNYVGLGPIEPYIQPRLSIGAGVSEQTYGVGQFKVQIDAEELTLVIKNNRGRTIWKSLHNTPFLSTTAGRDIFETSNNGSLNVTEHDDHRCLLQTITHVEHTEDVLTIYGGLSTKLVLPTHLDYTFTLTALSPCQLAFKAEIKHCDPPMKDHQRILLLFASRKEEDFYGFGEQLTHTSQKGRKIYIFARDRSTQGTSGILDSSYHALANLTGTEKHATYTAVPQYITTDNRCLLLENSEYASFDLRQQDRVLVRLNSHTMTGRLLDGESMLSLISEYTTFSGRMKPLPQWILQGAVANIQGGEEKVRQVVKQLRQYKVPMAAIWIQDWCGKHVQEKDYGGIFKQIWYNWESDDELYPHWDALVEELQEDGIRVLAYTNVLLTDTRSKPNVRRNLFKEAQQNGYLVKDALGQALITCSDTSSESGILDLTNPEAVVWFKKVLTDLVWKTGVAGMMADCGQNFPYDTRNCTLYSGELAETYHNQYSANWAKLHCDLIHELGMENEAVNFYRSGYITTPDYASLIWVGEQTTTWNHVDGIKSAITGMLSGGFSGFSVTHSDIGGYTTIDSVIPGIQMHRSKELLQRWMELAVFTAVFRTHEGSVPENNAQFYDNEESFTHFAHTANMYVSLAPYREHLINEAHEKGWPLMRHMVLYYPDDPTVRQITYSQFMLGPWLLVAPVTSPSASFVKVYFPKENNQTLWRHIWTGKYYAADGSYVAVNTPLGQPAAFVKEPREDGGLLHGLLEYARNAYCNPPPS